MLLAYIGKREEERRGEERDVQVVHSVASCTIYYWRISSVFAVVDHDGPDVDEDEEGNVCEFLEGKEKRK